VLIRVSVFKRTKSGRDNFFYKSVIFLKRNYVADFLRFFFPTSHESGELLMFSGFVSIRAPVVSLFLQGFVFFKNKEIVNKSIKK
jgi:hypothetical protein